MMSSKLKNIIYPKPLPDINTINTINNKDIDTKDTTSETTNDSTYIIKYINGGISGMCGILLSHPIDTIKTHIQTGNKLNTFKPSFKNFYKGISAPLLGVGIEKAIVFGTYNYMYSKTDNIPLSGAISGLTASLVVTPYERIKILKQNSEAINFKDVNTRFLFRGLSATFTREMPGFAIYFTTYEYLKKKTFTDHNKKIDYTSSFIYGGLSGITAWIFIYPQDRIKTILQSHSGRETNTNNIKSIINSIYASGGLKHFYSGFSWAVARASLLHSGTFCVMEYLNNKY
jgi:solute carrier family 25 carnitine/acylcarnitine transporter 20/29